MPPEYYQPPATHDTHIRLMLISLAAFFFVIAVMMILFFIFASRLAQVVPFSAEKRFVRPYEIMAERWLAGEPGAETETIEMYLQSLTDRLSVTMAVPSDYEINVHYLESDVVNAFVTLGGHLFVYEGLLKEMPDENSLAMVLAHELAHIKNRDPVAAMGRGLAMALMYAFATGDYSAGADIASVGGDLGIAKFSRDQEKAADLAALQAMQEHYGHVGGYGRFLDFVLEALESPVDDDDASEAEKKFARLFDSHPATLARIETLEAQVSAMGWKTGQLTPLPEGVNKALRENSDSVIPDAQPE